MTWVFTANKDRDMTLTRFNRVKKCALWGMLGLNALMLSGCGGSGGDDLKKLTESQTSLTYVNATNDVVNFYLKRDDMLDDNDQNTLFEANHQVFSDVALNASRTYLYTFKVHQNAVHLGLNDTNTLVKKGTNHVRLDFKYNETSSLWVVAWMMGSQFKLTYFGKEASNQEGVYKVRVFTDTAMPVSINGSKQVELTTEQGSATRALAISNCATGLEVGGRNIDLCHADLGRSYLVIVDQMGLRSLLPES